MEIDLATVRGGLDSLTTCGSIGLGTGLIVGGANIKLAERRGLTPWRTMFNAIGGLGWGLLGGTVASRYPWDVVGRGGDRLSLDVDVTASS
jgi:hypothetical protein